MSGLLNPFKKLRSRLSFDTNEQEILRLLSSRHYPQLNGSSRRLYVQVPSDFYYFALFSEAIKELRRKGDFVPYGVCPTIFTVRPKTDLLFPIRVLYEIITFYLLQRKWMKLYKAIIKDIVFVDSVPLSRQLSFMVESIRTWSAIKSKQELLALTMSGVVVGDLIYDTYLRYRARRTVRIGSVSLLYYIYKARCVAHVSEELASYPQIHSYLSSYSTYIQHGIPVRIFLKNNITVMTAGNLQQRFKKLSVQDHLHTSSHHRYKLIFQSLDDKTAKIEKGMAALRSKFSGIIDSTFGYMKESAYQNATEQQDARKFDGVLFLHDFYDSPHIYRNMLFPDFYEWMLHTFRLIEKHGLNIGVKPHPNQIAGSKEDIERLKREFKNILWIDPKTSNKDILSSGITFGISVYGTVLHELAFHGIQPISAGDHPHSAFDFVHNPGTVEEYDRLILNAGNLSLPQDYKNQVATFYYMHHFHPKEELKINEELFQGFSIFNATSELGLRSVTSSN
jgi:hypothetical protein